MTISAFILFCVIILGIIIVLWLFFTDSDHCIMIVVPFVWLIAFIISFPFLIGNIEATRKIEYIQESNTFLQLLDDSGIDNIKKKCYYILSQDNFDEIEKAEKIIELIEISESLENNQYNDLGFEIKRGRELIKEISLLIIKRHKQSMYNIRWVRKQRT